MEQRMLLHRVHLKIGASAILGLCMGCIASGALGANAGPAPSSPAKDAAQTKDPTGAVEAISAIVNEDLITTYDVRQRMLLIIASTGIQPNQQNVKQIQDQALRSLIEENLQLQEAKEYKVDVTDKEVNSAIASIAQQNGATLEQFQQNFVNAGINLDGLRQQLRADIAWRRIVNGRYGSRVRVSEERVKETLARIEANASKPQYLVSEIFLYAEGPTEQAQAQQAAARLLEEMKKGAPFPVVARQFSSAPSAAVGGDLGWMRSGELRPEVEAALQNMQPGFVSEPIEVAGGVYLVALRDRRTGQSATERVTIKGLQLSKTDGQSIKALDRVRKDIKSCDSLDAVNKRLANANVLDFGELTLTDLTPDMQQRVGNLAPGQVTDVFTEEGVPQVIVMCNRRKETEGLPSAEEVESRLYEQELSLIARRWLRDLRRDSTIITR